MRAFDQRKTNNPDSSSFFGPKIQKKLKTGTVGDKYEVEADNVADKVVNNKPAAGGLLQSKEQVQQKSISDTISSVQAKEMKEEDKSVQKKSDKDEDKKVQKKSDKEEDKTVQKKCAECEKEDKVQKKEEKEKDKTVQKKGKNTESDIQNNELEGKLDSSKGGGTGLDKNTKSEMESGFGTDFSNVKIHTDASAVQMSQELGAQAFTNGNDVYFNEGKYNPGSKEGKHLLAHELTHTVQQTGSKQKSGTIQKSSVKNDKKHPEDLRTEKPMAKFKDNPPLEKTNDDKMLISTGQKGPYVADLQKGLLEAGEILPKFGADGDFGNETRNAVVGFQSKNNLNKIDGIVGPETMGVLDNVLVKKIGDGKRPPCKPKKNNTAPFSKKFNGQESVGFITTEGCFKVNIQLNAECLTKDCTAFTLHIDDDPSTKKTVKMDKNFKKSENFSFEMSKPGHHDIVFTMPLECKGAVFIESSTFKVSGTLIVTG